MLYKDVWPYWTDSFVWRNIHRYILVLTQTIKNKFLVKFSPTQPLASSGLLQYCDSSPEEASSCVGDNLTRNLFLIVCHKINMYLWMSHLTKDIWCHIKCIIPFPQEHTESTDLLSRGSSLPLCYQDSFGTKYPIIKFQALGQSKVPLPKAITCSLYPSIQLHQNFFTIRS